MGRVKKAADYHFLTRPFKSKEPCADLPYVEKRKNGLFFALADVAGHGIRAHALSLVIKKYFIETDKVDLLRLMSGLHDLLRGSRGAVVVVGFFFEKTGTVKYVGIGNVTMRIFGHKHTRIISNEGIVGYIIPTPKIKRLHLSARQVLVLYTDGIRDHFEPYECPAGFFDKNAKHIANGILKRFSRGNDDASCIAIRYKND